MQPRVKMATPNTRNLLAKRRAHLQNTSHVRFEDDEDTQMTDTPPANTAGFGNMQSPSLNFKENQPFATSAGHTPACRSKFIGLPDGAASSASRKPSISDIAPLWSRTDNPMYLPTLQKAPKPKPTQPAEQVIYVCDSEGPLPCIHKINGEKCTTSKFAMPSALRTAHLTNFTDFEVRDLKRASKLKDLKISNYQKANTAMYSAVMEASKKEPVTVADWKLASDQAKMDIDRIVRQVNDANAQGKVYKPYA